VLANTLPPTRKEQARIRLAGKNHTSSRPEENTMEISMHPLFTGNNHITNKNTSIFVKNRFLPFFN
jgi:hypothetical protein